MQLSVGQIWNNNNIFYKIVKITNNKIVVLVRNGPVGRWQSKKLVIDRKQFKNFNFVKNSKESKFIEIKFNSNNNFKCELSNNNRYVITYAQNATVVHDNFFEILLKYCEINDAKLIVVPGYYRINSMLNDGTVSNNGDCGNNWWDPKLNKYLHKGRLKLCDNLILYCDVHIPATAVRPLSGLDSFVDYNSGIFGHPRLQLSTLASIDSRARLITTTGACTVANYSHTKAGKRSEKMHVIGAIVVEIDNDNFFIRQIDADSNTGEFIDLEWKYTKSGKKKAKDAKALILGDVHAEKVDDKVLQASFDMIRTMKCRKAIYHDLLDFDVRNHHSIDNFKNRYSRSIGVVEDSVENELSRTIEIIESTPSGAVPVVVQSNHDEAFDKWLDRTDIKSDPVNALLYYRMWVWKLEYYNKHKKWVPAFQLYYKSNGFKRAEFVGRNNNYLIGDILCGYHGDVGLNGSRGSYITYNKLGYRCVVGHSHSPSIIDKCYTVGVVGNLDQGYNKPPSSWAHANCIIYANGKMSLLFVDNLSGRWRL